MERFRVVYYNADGEADEAIVDGEEGHEAAKSIENMGRLLTITSLGPADTSAHDEPAGDGNGTSESYPWRSREERLEDQGSA